MPEPLRRAIHQFVSEAVLNCQEVLRYTEPDMAWDWKRMTLYRAADAADALDMASLLIAAYLQDAGADSETIHSYMQSKQQQSRSQGPGRQHQAELDGLMGRPTPEDKGPLSTRHSFGRNHAKAAQTNEVDPQEQLTAGCLHGLLAKLCDDVDSLDGYLPPQAAAMARRVADTLELLSSPPA